MLYLLGAILVAIAVFVAVVAEKMFQDAIERYRKGFRKSGNISSLITMGLELVLAGLVFLALLCFQAASGFWL